MDGERNENGKEWWKLRERKHRGSGYRRRIVRGGRRNGNKRDELYKLKQNSNETSISRTTSSMPLASKVKSMMLTDAGSGEPLYLYLF